MNKLLLLIFLVLTFCSEKEPETTQKEWVKLSKKFSGFIDRDEYDSALKIANIRLEIAESSSIEQWKADAYNDLGIILMYFGQFEKSEDYLIKSLAYNEDAVGLHNLSLVQKRLTKYDDAYLSATKSFEMYRSDTTKSQKDLFRSKLAIAAILNAQKKFEESTNLIEEVVEFAQNEQDSSFLMEAINSLGKVCVYSEQYEQAYPLYRKLIGYYDRQNLPIQKAEGYNDLGSVFHQDGKYDSAIAFYERSIKLKLQHTQDSSIIRINLRNIANAYGRLNQPEKEQEIRNIIARIESKIR